MDKSNRTQPSSSSACSSGHLDEPIVDLHEKNTHTHNEAKW